MYVVEFQQFDVLATVPSKKGLGARLMTALPDWVKSLVSEKKEVFQQDLSLYFAACVLNCCGLLTSSPTGRIHPPDSLDALQLELTSMRLAKLRGDFESYLDRAGFSYQEVLVLLYLNILYYINQSTINIYISSFLLFLSPSLKKCFLILINLIFNIVLNLVLKV